MPIDKHFIIGNILFALLNKKTFIKKNPNSVIRSYLSEKDLIKILVKLINLANKQLEIYNVGSDEKVEIVSFLNILKKNYNFKFFEKKSKISTIDYYVPSIEKLRKKNLIPQDKFNKLFEKTLGFHKNINAK